LLKCVILRTVPHPPKINKVRVLQVIENFLYVCFFDFAEYFMDIREI
jgi:hypothetical protein